LGDQKEERGHVVAKAVLAGEEVEEFARHEPMTVLAPVLAPVPRLAKDLLVGDRPGDAGYGQGEQKKIRKLLMQSHKHKCHHPTC
jgi:hypothetical protein